MLTVCFYVAAGLLVLAGVVKLRDPEPTSRALRGVGLPPAHALVRGFGLLEILVGAGALAAPGPAAPVLALLYACFAAFVGYVLWRRLPLSSCGCLGETETRPSAVHIVLTVCAAVVGTAAAISPPPGLGPLAAGDPLLMVPLTLGLATALYLTYVTLALLPDALSAYSPAAPEGEAPS